jgi:hypothetical protein
VLSRTLDAESQPLCVCRSEEELIERTKTCLDAGKRIFAIGGESVYALVFTRMREYISSVITTQVNCDIPDTKEKTIRRFNLHWFDGFKLQTTTRTYRSGGITYNHMLWTQGGQELCD